MQNEIYLKKKQSSWEQSKKINHYVFIKNYSTLQVPTDLDYIFINML